MLVIIMAEFVPIRSTRPVAGDQVLRYRRREMEEANADKSMAPRINAGAMSRTVDWST